jgi:Membrane domain of glycerophosphoryl diester phosphodiesterase
VFGLIFLLVFGTAVAGGVLAAATSGGHVPGTFAILMIVVFVLIGFALAIAFSMRYALSLPAMLIEEMRVGASVRRSVQLSQGRRGQIFLAIALGILLLYAMAALFQGPFYAGAMVAGVKGKLPISLALGMAISSAIGGTIGGPLLMIVLVLYYYDLRIRKEAFDLQQMMASLPGTDAGSVVAPAEPWRLTI